MLKNQITNNLFLKKSTNSNFWKKNWGDYFFFQSVKTFLKERIYFHYNGQYGLGTAS